MLIKTPAIHLSQAEKNPVFLTSSTYRALIKINLFWDILVLIPKLIMRLGQCSGKGLTFEKSAIETLYGGQFQSSIQFTKIKSSCNTHNQHSTTISLETFALYSLKYVKCGWSLMIIQSHCSAFCVCPTEYFFFVIGTFFKRIFIHILFHCVNSTCFLVMWYSIK